MTRLLSAKCGEIWKKLKAVWLLAYMTKTREINSVWAFIDIQSWSLIGCSPPPPPLLLADRMLNRGFLWWAEGWWHFMDWGHQTRYATLSVCVMRCVFLVLWWHRCVYTVTSWGLSFLTGAKMQVSVMSVIIFSRKTWFNVRVCFRIISRKLI